MRAMVLHNQKTPLKLENVVIPRPSQGQVLIRVQACGVCRTDLHILDGDLPSPHLPLILGHQIVGLIIDRGLNVTSVNLGQRVGVPWVSKTCGHCSYCLRQEENLCDQLLCTGYQVNGGFADYCLADASSIYNIPDHYSSVNAAPLLCGGLIGFRALRFIPHAKTIGFFGFGSAAHLLMPIATHFQQKIAVFTRPKDIKAQVLAKNLGAFWVGSTSDKPDQPLDAAIIFAPSGDLVPIALQAVSKGGTVVCAGIHMSAIPSFSYDLLYGERILRSVTNLTHQDGKDFFELLKHVRIEPTIKKYPLEKANQALKDLRDGKMTGSAVIDMEMTNNEKTNLNN